MQVVTMKMQASQCDKEDILAGNDDPDLPLVTCSQDHQTVYLLKPSLISGDEIADASSGMDQRSGANIVQVQFKSGAADRWADFTANNIGTQTAFTLDSQVVSAPVIQEAIPGGRTQITGGSRASPRTRHASWPTCSSTVRCRCRSRPPRRRPSRPRSA